AGHRRRPLAGEAHRLQRRALRRDERKAVARQGAGAWTLTDESVCPTVGQALSPANLRERFVIMLHSRYEIAMWGVFGFLRRFRAGRSAGGPPRGPRHSATARA